MGLTLRTKIGSGLGLVSYFSGAGTFQRAALDSTTDAYYNASGGHTYDATLMTTADTSSSAPVYSRSVLLGHQLVVAGGGFSFLPDASLVGTVGGLAAGEVLVLHFPSVESLFRENDVLYGNVGNDVLEGFDGIDSINGDAGDDILLGDASNDTLRGGFGRDLLFGGDDDDRLSGGFGADLIDGGAGIDTADYLESSAAVAISLLAGTASGGEATGDTLSSIENLLGSVYNDALTGDGGANVLSGYIGDDVLSGGGGDDLLIGSMGRDVLDGGDGVDTALYDGRGSVTVSLAKGIGRGADAQGDTFVSIENVVMVANGDDTLIGSSANNLLAGGSGNDTLIGLGGNDTLEGGAGFDTMTGGGGRDIFKVGSSPQDTGDDVVNDYVDGVDKISFVGTGITSFAQVRIQDGNGTTSPGSTFVITALGDVILQHTDFHLIDASDFLFDTAPAPPHGHAWAADLLTGAGLHAALA